MIIDCFEVFIEKPTNLLARAQTFSNYKHHNTMRVLIGTTPQGSISFVSEAWGGRTSDKFLTENCGFLNKRLLGDMVMVDRSFTISESVGLQQGELAIPPPRWIITLTWWGGLRVPMTSKATSAGALSSCKGYPCRTGRKVGSRRRMIHWSSRLGIELGADNPIL